MLETEFRASFYESVLRSIPIGTVALNSELVIASVNPALGEVFGTSADFLGAPLRELLSVVCAPVQARELEATLRKTLASGTAFSREVQTSTGERTLRVTNAPLSQGEEGSGLVLLIEDITGAVRAAAALARLLTEAERSRRTLQQLSEGQESALRALKESERRFRALVQITAQIVWATDADGAVREDSPSWRAFTGQKLEEWKGFGWLDAIHPEDRERARAYWRDAVASGTRVDEKFRVRHAGGEWRWMRVRAVPLLDEAGRVTGWVGMNTEIAGSSVLICVQNRL